MHFTFARATRQFSCLCVLPRVRAAASRLSPLQYFLSPAVAPVGESPCHPALPVHRALNAGWRPLQQLLSLCFHHSLRGQRCGAHRVCQLGFTRALCSLPLVVFAALLIRTCSPS